MTKNNRHWNYAGSKRGDIILIRLQHMPPYVILKFSLKNPTKSNQIHMYNKDKCMHDLI
jgi:hypothetical protein